MSRTANIFRHTDIVRAVKAARACGLAIERTEIAPDGRIILVHHVETPAIPGNEYEKWKAVKNARAS